MNKFFTMLGLTLVLSVAVQAQVFEMVSAKEILPQVLVKAKAELDTDVIITHVVFAGITYQNVMLQMDTATGKANGWVYRYYSPGHDSARCPGCFHVRRQRSKNHTRQRHVRGIDRTMGRLAAGAQRFEVRRRFILLPESS